MNNAYDIVVLGLSITSSWGNGHATTYRALVRELAARGHRVLFLERDLSFYAAHRDLPSPPYGATAIYSSFDDLVDRFTAAVRDADVVIVGSFVPEGVRVGKWVTSVARGKTAFYDIDTPVTLRAVDEGTCAYLSMELLPRYQLYLSFTGGPILQRLEQRYGATRARPLYCSVDPEAYFPERGATRWHLGYLGTYSDDRQPIVDSLLIEPARQYPGARFVVAGPQYPPSIRWPSNVQRVDHLPPSEHRAFYNGQRFTLNVTRADMMRAGWSPSVRVFEAAACGTPIITDAWPGLEQFLEPGRDVFVARAPGEVLSLLRCVSAKERREVGARARARILAEHTSACRARTLERWIDELFVGTRGRVAGRAAASA